MERIASRQNPLVKRFRELARRRAVGHLLLDSEHLLLEALDSGVALEAVALADSLGPARLGDLDRRARAAGARTVVVNNGVLGAISPVRTPSGVVAIARHAATSLEEALARPPQLVLMLGGIQDAGNVGAIVRAADAFGATGIVAAEATADPLGWKALRGAMGSSFRVPIAIRQSLADAVGAARVAGLKILAAVPRGGRWLHDCDLRAPIALVLGAEGAGVPAAVTAGADEQITIAMRERVESLNVAVAAAVILYEAARQRAEPGTSP